MAQFVKNRRGPDFDGFYKEWKARGLYWPFSSRAIHDEKVKTDSMIEDLERQSDSLPLIVAGIGAVFAIFAAMLAYLLIP